MYTPQSEVVESCTRSIATLFLKLMSYLLEAEISALSLYHVMFKGWEPDTRASTVTVLPTESTMDSEGFLMKFGGTLRSVSEGEREGNQVELCKGESVRNSNLLFTWPLGRYHGNRENSSNPRSTIQCSICTQQIL